MACLFFICFCELDYTLSSQATQITRITLNLTGAINLLSKGKSEIRKPSVYAGLQALISTFYLFELTPVKYILNGFAYGI